MAMLGTLVQLGIAAIEALAAVAIVAWPAILAVLLAAALTALAIKFWPQITKFLKESWENVSSWAKETWPKVTKWFSDIWDNISGWFANLASKVGGWVAGVWNTLWGGIKNWGSNFSGIGKSLIEGLWNGINDKINWIRDKIGEFCKNVTNWFKNLFGISSPSKLFKNLIGKNLALGLREGFTDEMKEVSKEMASSVPTDFSTPNINADSPIYGASALNLNSHPNNFNTNPNSLSTDENGLILAFKEALTGMAFKIDGDKIGELVINQVERVVFS
jgi:phage-related protein